MQEKPMTIHRNHLAAAIASLVLCAALPALAADQPMPQDQSSTTTTTTVTKHNYVYYPEHDIYFSPEKKTYYYQVNGNWTAGTTLPAEDMPYVRSKGVTIELDTDRPYERHDYVIAHYKNKLKNEVHEHGDSDRD
jgi:hypothetical protein